jgi:hypothetical protein
MADEVVHPLIFTSPSVMALTSIAGMEIGAGEGNRTLASTLATSWATITPHPQILSTDLTDGAIFLSDCFFRNNVDHKIGTTERSRTSTGLLPADFESAAATSYATVALVADMGFEPTKSSL